MKKRARTKEKRGAGYTKERCRSMSRSTLINIRKVPTCNQILLS